ncbi:MAG: GAF domain-containing protein, partial [Planctomycetota bacterium]
MGQTTIVRSVRSLVDSKRILDVLLKNLIQKKTITPEDTDVLMSVTIRKIADAIFAQAITVFTVDQVNHQIRFQNVYYSPSLYGTDDAQKKRYEKKAHELEAITLPTEQGIVGQVIKSGETAFVADAQRDPRFNRQVDRNTGFTTLSMIAVPLKVGDAVVGCIQVLNKCQDGQIVTQFTQEDVLILEDVARYSAKVIQRAKDPNTPFTEREMASFVARQTKLEFLELDAKFEPDTPLLQSFGEELLKRYQILPLKKLTDDTLRAALSNPLDFHRIEDFLVETGVQIVEKVVTAGSDIKTSLLRVFPEMSQVTEMAAAVTEEYAGHASDHVEIEAFEDDENSAPIVRLGNKIIEDAYLKGSSDIH